MSHETWAWKPDDIVRFVHQRETGPDHTIIMVIQRTNGQFVTLNDMSGQFAVHLFVKAESLEEA